MTLLSDVLRHLDMYRSFIIAHDIPKAIEGKCNYLAALGLSTYTEVFGGFYNGNLRQGNGRKNYNSFIYNFFHDDYKGIDSRLYEDKLKGLYGAVRSGLVHEYLMRDTSMVVMHRSKPMTCGIVYNPNESPKIIFVVEQYFSDFIKAFQRYYARVKKEPELVQKFEQSLQSINSHLARSRKIT
jgi:hypothetical protein